MTTAERDKLVANAFIVFAFDSKQIWEDNDLVWDDFIQSESYLSIPPAELRDKYHTMDELYKYRMVYNAILFNEWFAHGKYEVHKSKRHNDGEPCFGGGWFIVVAILPTGQISNHYKEEYWDLFQCESIPSAKYPFDGHTPNDVLIRLKSIPPATNELRERIANYNTIKERLVTLYPSYPSFVAKVCDEVLDRSGALLGDIRTLNKPQP